MYLETKVLKLSKKKIKCTHNHFIVSKGKYSQFKYIQHD